MSTYQLGSYANGVAGVQDIESITQVPPQPTAFLEFSEVTGMTLSDKPNESGYARTAWKWSYLTQAAFNALVTYCTGATAEVYVRTRVNSGTSYSFGVFRATMVRPSAETAPGLLRTSVRVDFLNLRTPP